MTTNQQSQIDLLRGLLAAPATDPQAQIAAMRTARQLATAGDPLARDLVRLDLAFLLRQADKDGLVGSAPALSAARHRVLDRDFAALAATDGRDVTVPFELAAIVAEARFSGDGELAARCDEELARRCPLLPAGELLREEARERWATLTTEEEDLPLGHKVQLLRATGTVLLQLAAVQRDRLLRRLGRRLSRAANDRELLQRMEARIGHRGAVVLETTSFVLLLLVLGLILVDALVTLSPLQQRLVQWTDGLVCLFFIVEFAWKLWLTPGKWSWFLRNAVTDLLPALPAVLLLPGFGAPGADVVADDLVLVRLLRLLRVTWAARYVQALRPLLRLLRLVLFLVRGMDGLVERFSPLLNRNFVFFDDVGDAADDDDEPQQRRRLLHGLLRREHELLAALPHGSRAELVAQHAAQLGQPDDQPPVPWPDNQGLAATARDIPVARAVDFLWGLRPEDLGHWLSRSDLLALDRVVRVVSAPVVRWLPVARRLAVSPLPPTPPERVAAMGRRVAAWLHGWRARLLFIADLHGIVTGPQILDRFASALVRVTQRPAVRLLLFGGFFTLVDLLIKGNLVQRFVGTPLLILGSICLVLLMIGWWLKRIAGEASDAFRLTSEAHFISLLELCKKRFEAVDLQFLVNRVFRSEADPAPLLPVLQRQVGGGRRGLAEAPSLPSRLVQETSRVALLYLHFLDGGILHETDAKTTEQLLANLSLENVRQHWLAHGKRDKKRLKDLRLDDGTLLRGPFLWFRFITESAAVEAAKRIAEYNRHCLSLQQQRRAGEVELDAMRDWLRRRVDPAAARSPQRTEAPGAGIRYRTTEFTALDFLAADEQRDEHLRQVFGDAVLAAVQQDRANMIREIFGMRPLQKLPKSARSFNAYRNYHARLSHGRVFLAPLFGLLRVAATLRWGVSKVASIAREVLRPTLALQRREVGKAPFAVAMRKIHRMKAPGLLEAMRMRGCCDPAYCGAPGAWSDQRPLEAPSELERDLAFLHLNARDSDELRTLAQGTAQRAQQWHALVTTLPPLGDVVDEPEDRQVGELATTIAFATDQEHVRTLLAAADWRRELLALVQRPVPGSLFGDLLGLARRRSPMLDFVRQHLPALPWRQRQRLHRAYAQDLLGTRAQIAAHATLAPGADPATAALARLRAIWREGDAYYRELLALRTVQSLSVLDLRNYRDLVFRLGNYAADGESAARALELP